MIPVFIVSPVRSGSTFLRLMLNSHPAINNPGECDFLFDRLDDSGKYPDKESYINFLDSNSIFQSKNLEIDKNLNFDDLIYSFVNQLDQEGSVLSVNIHRHFHRIPFLFPQAKYIHLLRDPRDVARSAIGMGWVGHVYQGVDIWIEAEKSWDKLKKQIQPIQWLEIKYEDILNDVEGGLTNICNFLGLEYSEEMLNYAENSSYSLPDKSLSYQWKRKYTQRELELVEGKLGDLLTSRGYELSGVKPQLPKAFEKISLALKNKQYRAIFDIKRYGLILYLERYFSKFFPLPFWKASIQNRINAVNAAYLK